MENAGDRNTYSQLKIISVTDMREGSKAGIFFECNEATIKD
jgi:hypothetical protein